MRYFLYISLAYRVGYDRPPVGLLKRYETINYYYALLTMVDIRLRSPAIVAILPYSHESPSQTK